MSDDPRPDLDIAPYTAAIALIGQQATLLWTVSGAFFIPQTALLAFLLTRDAYPAWDPSVFAGALIGIPLLAIWYATLRRAAVMYELRMAQAREVEPQDWGFLTRGRVVAEGGTAVVDGTRYAIPRHARVLRTRYASRVLAGILVLAYSSLIALSGWWWSSDVQDERRLARVFALESACFLTPRSCEPRRLAPNVWEVKGVGGVCYVLDLKQFRVSSRGMTNEYYGIGKVPCGSL